MIITKIKIIYSTSIPIAPYGIKDLAGAEMEVDTQGEPYNYKELFSQLKATVDEAVKEEYPYLYGSTVSKEHLLYPLTPQEVQIEKPTEEEILSTEQQILSCKEMKVLESYKLIVKKNPGLLLAYQKMEQQLQKQTV